MNKEIADLARLFDECGFQKASADLREFQDTHPELPPSIIDLKRQIRQRRTVQGSFDIANMVFRVLGDSGLRLEDSTPLGFLYIHEGIDPITEAQHEWRINLKKLDPDSQKALTTANGWVLRKTCERFGKMVNVGLDKATHDLTVGVLK